VAQNLLSILERLTTFPTDKEELNEWWISEFGSKPTKGVAPSTEGNEEEEGDDDWRKFFEDEEPASKAKEPTSRLHRMTLHQCLHSLPSHRAVFTRTWLSLLPQISDIESIDARKGAVKRILNVLHRGVLPHLTRAILVMDWVAGCVDLGAPFQYPKFQAYAECRRLCRFACLERTLYSNEGTQLVCSLEVSFVFFDSVLGIIHHSTLVYTLSSIATFFISDIGHDFSALRTFS